MPFIRLSDDYIDHPKFLALSDGAFRLWHEGMSYTRKHQTDGLIPFATMHGFRYFTKSREKQLSTPYIDGAAPLWDLVRGVGYRVHDYLFWNLSKEEEQTENAAATARMRRLRAKRKAEKEQERSGEHEGEQLGERSPFVLDRLGTGSGSVNLERGSGGKPDARSKRPIFAGQRLTVFEWMLDDCVRTLTQEVAEQFDLHEWFFALDAQAVRDGLVIPKRDSGSWLQQQLVSEAQRRGLNLKLATTDKPAVQPWTPSVRPYERAKTS